ncbi:MAG: LPS export ABC transporter periplasmic protein LptC [Nitrospirota bacterium]
MKGLNYPWVILIAGFFVLVFFLGFFGSPEKRLEDKTPIREASADLSLSDVLFVQTRAGVKEWALQAKQAQLFENDQTAHFKTISFELETMSGIPLTLSADSGKMDMAGEHFTMQKEKHPVSVTWREGYTIETSELNWSANQKKIESNSPVQIKMGDKISILGEELMIALDDATLNILGNVHAKIN